MVSEGILNEFEKARDEKFNKFFQESGMPKFGSMIRLAFNQGANWAREWFEKMPQGYLNMKLHDKITLQSQAIEKLMGAFKHCHNGFCVNHGDNVRTQCFYCRIFAEVKEMLK